VLHVPAAPISSLARKSLKIFDAMLAAFTPLLVDIAPMRPPPPLSAAQDDDFANYTAPDRVAPFIYDQDLSPVSCKFAL
jgi:hypothetical protein